MPVDIVIAPHSEAFVHVWTSPGIERELSEAFSYEVPGAKYMRGPQRKYWNGKVSLYHRTTKLIYAGLLRHVVQWAESKGYSVKSKVTTSRTAWTDLDTAALCAEYPTSFELRDYQREAITHALAEQRCVLLSPTASGKSAIVYYLVRERMKSGPVLIIVPNISLVRQLVEDFRQYGWTDVDDHVHQITGGVSKRTGKPVVCSTWQSIFKQPDEWFTRFHSVIGDEAHLHKADSLKGILERMPWTPFRVGVTGTLDDIKSHALVVQGVFGPVHRVAKTKDLQVQGHLTPIRVQSHMLEYGPYDRWTIREHYRTYQEEMDYIVQHPGRMAWITDFVQQLRGNVLVLFQYVEKHGVPLYQSVCQAVAGQRPVYFVSGDVDGDTREQIRALVESAEHIVLSFGEKEIRCVPDELVPLSSGESVPANEITIDMDVDDRWLLNRSKELFQISASVTPTT